jgi:hypothetical protein
VSAVSLDAESNAFKQKGGWKAEEVKMLTKEQKSIACHMKPMYW